jgi:biotin operon repressor
MNWALSQKTGSHTAKSVLLILANRANESGRCYPGIDGIAAQTEISRRTIIRKIQELVESGLIEIVVRGGDGSGRKSNLYQLNMMAKCQPDTLGQCANLTGQCANGAGQCATVTPEPKDITQRVNPKVKASKRVPVTWKLTEKMIDYAMDAGMTEAQVKDEVEGFRDHEYRSAKKDWDAAWRTWCRNWKKWSRDKPNKKLSYAEQLKADMIANGMTEGFDAN